MGQRNGKPDSTTLPAKLKSEKIDQLAQLTGFTDKDIRQRYQSFVASCPKGGIAREDFVKLFRDLYPNGGDPTKYGQLLFVAFDQNKDNILQFDEYLHALSLVTGKAGAEAKLKWIFRLYDIDDDGLIGKAEMLTTVEAMFAMLGKKQDADGRTAAQRVDRIFQLWDKNEDGKLDMGEFRDGVKQDSAMLLALSLYDGVV